MRRRGKENRIAGDKPGQPVIEIQAPPGVTGSQNVVDLDFPFDSVIDPRTIGEYSPTTPDYLWVAGDGDTPTIGPSTPVSGVPSVGTTPWQGPDSLYLESEIHDAASYRATATDMDPALGEDVVALVSTWVAPNADSNPRVLFGTRNSGMRGWALITQNGFLYYLITGNTTVQRTFRSHINGSQYILALIIPRSAGTISVVDGSTVYTGVDACPAGALGSSSGLGIAATPAATNLYRGGVAYAAMWKGSGLAALWQASSHAVPKELIARLNGVYPRVGSTAAFTRNSAATWHDDRSYWHISSEGMPRAGNITGFWNSAARTNKCYNTMSPTVTTGWSTSGGTLSTVDDRTATITAGIQSFGYNVFKFIPGGSDQVVYGGASTGAIVAHSSSVFMRGAVGGENVDIARRRITGGTVTNLGTKTLTTNWTRYEVDNWTPGFTDEQFCLDCNAGDTIYFIAPQMEASAFTSTPIPNYATAASATTIADILTTTHTLTHAEGSMSSRITPRGWSNVSGAFFLLWTTGGGVLLIYGSSSNKWSLNDGTTAISADKLTSDGVENKVRVKWRGSTMSITADGLKTTGPYDGTIGAGSVKIDNGGQELTVLDVRSYERGI